MLGSIAENFETFAVAGTHGKTTTTAMLAHLLQNTPGGCNAFLGGVLSSSGSNVALNPNSTRLVVEADEFDRSFLQLHPMPSLPVWILTIWTSTATWPVFRPVFRPSPDKSKA
jgi:UDP-N-acetylmuramate--alanine ligase